MTKEIVNKVISECKNFLTSKQLTKLKKVLVSTEEIKTALPEESDYRLTNGELFNLFISSKRVEGCSAKSIKMYHSVILSFIKKMTLNFNEITTDDIRSYINEYEEVNKISKISLDNIRRVLSSLFSWLFDEEYIVRNPMRRIHKIKTPKIVKQAFTDEDITNLKDNCSTMRDLAIVDLLSSSGIRVSELVNLKIQDIDFVNQECIVMGKGSKERKAYFDSITKIHLKAYIDSRLDMNESLFVSLIRPYSKLQISGVESMLKKLSLKANVDLVYPHRFRRTLATKAIDKGMPIEQVQALLGHSKIDTTLMYAIVSQNNVRTSYRKLIG